MKKEKKNRKKNERKAVTGKTQAAAESNVSAATPASNGRAQKRTERRRVVNEDLQLEIATLRQSVDEMLTRYKLKLDAELVQLAGATSNGAVEDGKKRLPIATAEAMLKQIRGLEIKAGKGRAKDFQRVQDLVGSLIEQLPSEK